MYAISPNARVCYLVRVLYETPREWCLTLIFYDTNVLGMITVLLITRTALNYPIFVDELWLSPADIRYLKKKLSKRFLCEHAESQLKTITCLKGHQEIFHISASI